MASLQHPLRRMVARRGQAMRAVAATASRAPPQNVAATIMMRSRSVSTAAPATPDKQRAAFDRDGFLVVENFATAAECDAMRAQMAKLVAEWDGLSRTVFRTDGEQEAAQGSSDYFLDSADRCHFFLEPDAVDPDTGGIRAGLPRLEAMNKAGHGLHSADPVFREYAQSGKVAALTRALGWAAPVLPQSMYIFKQPRIGGAVTSHQDSCFLYTTPRQTCLGLWLALHDATLNNGCVWARPGSHTEPVRRFFARNPEHFGPALDGAGGDPSAPQMVFEPGSDEARAEGEAAKEGGGAAPWEGALPELPEPGAKGAAAAGFVPCEVKAGDLVVIHGAVDHLSLPNTSEEPRHTFQLHLVEGPGAGVTWHPRNWLQLPGGKPFPALGGVE